MIKHEEIRELAKRLLTYTDLLNDYITEQEKRDELLELYRTQDKLLKMADVNIEVPTDEFVMWLNTTIKIKALEEELK